MVIIVFLVQLSRHSPPLSPEVSSPSGLLQRQRIDWSDEMSANWWEFLVAPCGERSYSNWTIFMRRVFFFIQMALFRDCFVWFLWWYGPAKGLQVSLLSIWRKQFLWKNLLGLLQGIVSSNRFQWQLVDFKIEKIYV